MRYRKLTASGDFSFGRGPRNFYVDEPMAVGQAVQTRLELEQGEWFLNTDDGTPYKTKILGTGTGATYDQAFRERILDTPGVTELNDYNSNLNRTTRALKVSGNIDTVYGETPPLEVTL